ncbi:MAG: hypothetical protein OQL06_08910 [Gammaproteobacteria bacterium]|nr:hypothetical protein [Gammaproteobacteria bacterium]
MTTAKRPLQKLSSYAAIISFILGVASAVTLYLRLPEHDINNPVSASLLACIFFFILVGFVLSIIGSANLPSFKFDTEEKDQ